MKLISKSEREADKLYVHLQDAAAEARCAGNYERARRIELLMERAWWRLMRRVSLNSFQHGQLKKKCCRKVRK